MAAVWRVNPRPELTTYAGAAAAGGEHMGYGIWDLISESDGRGPESTK